MDAQPQTRIGMPMDEFIRQYDEAPFELVDGERIPLALQVAGQATIVSYLAEAFFVYEQHAARFVLYFHLPFVKVDKAGWIVKVTHAENHCLRNTALARLSEQRTRLEG